MAEQEVIKHTKKIYKIWNNKENSLWHKTKDFLIEIFIIVFAITLSIWFHDRSEHAEQQKEVKEFLKGLSNDLKSDLNELSEDRKSYEFQRQAFNYLSSLHKDLPLNNDSINKYKVAFINISRLVQNNGRFEGFKSSGKIGTIENRELQNDIMDLYQEEIPALLYSTDAFIAHKNRLIILIEQNANKIGPQIILDNAIKTDEAKILGGILSEFSSEIINKYSVCMTKMNKILGEINSVDTKENK